MTPTRQAYGGATPSRTSVGGTRPLNATMPIDRASESLEKINDAFRQVSVGTFDELS